MGFKGIMPRPQCAKLSAEEHQNVLRIALWQRALRAVSQKRTGREGEERGIFAWWIAAPIPAQSCQAVSVNKKMEK